MFAVFVDVIFMEWLDIIFSEEIVDFVSVLFLIYETVVLLLSACANIAFPVKSFSLVCLQCIVGVFG